MNFSFYKHNEKPWPNKRLKNGVIIGHTTDTEAKIWIRTQKEGSYLLALVPVDYTDEDKEKRLNRFLDSKECTLEELEKSFPDAQSQEVKTSFKQDCTKVLEFKKLKSGSRYRYFLAAVGKDDRLEVVIDSLPYIASRKAEKNSSGSAGFYFQTLETNPKSFSFALFSCHNPYIDGKDEDTVVEVDAENMKAWDSFSRNLHRHRSPLVDNTSSNLAFVIGGGDQCYVDGRDKINIWNYLYKVMGAKEDGEVYPSQDDMVSWYRNIYRAYWGFPQVRTVFGMYPTYMTWDDHEIGDGWGSFENKGKFRHPIYKKAREKGLSDKQAKELLDRMFAAAKQVYIEYEHSHNPTVDSGQLYYDFSYGNANFYVLDGRGHRDINRNWFKILGKKQMEHFKKYVSNVKDNEVLFVVSAVPLLHTTALVTEQVSKIRFTGLSDDLKDSWEHPIHNHERGELMHCLWEAAKRGVKVCILSGDVHASAAFELSNGEHKIYQVTSSAITYHLNFFQRLTLRSVVTDSGDADGGAKYQRLAYFNKSSYAMLEVKEDASVAVRFYDATQNIELDNGKRKSILSSLATIKLWDKGAK